MTLYLCHNCSNLDSASSEAALFFVDPINSYGGIAR